MIELLQIVFVLVALSYLAVINRQLARIEFMNTRFEVALRQLRQSEPVQSPKVNRTMWDPLIAKDLQADGAQASKVKDLKHIETSLNG